ncbi:MAG: Ankyrin [Bacteroidetes bacterium]|jgi:hypothetical protein|nr:Ankyrin [Bacteroidota bacterium]
MSFFKKLFGGEKKNESENKKEQPQKQESRNETKIHWVEADGNEWRIRILDLRPITLAMLSTSQDPRMAENAVSYGGEDGTGFFTLKPESSREIKTHLSYPTDGKLEPGVLFIPGVMEHKWAIYFSGDHIVFVRSWLRSVVAIAKTVGTENEIIIESITGDFMGDESPEFTVAFCNYLLLSHALRNFVPAPLKKEFENDLEKAGLWAFSAYGKMAHFGIFDPSFLPKAKSVMRTHSLLHIAVARTKVDEIEKYIKQGMRPDSIAADGLATLHWSIACAGTGSMEKLLALGADPDMRSVEGATALMNAVQSNKKQHFDLLIKNKADVNAVDHRGFTALHRAAEMGHVDMAIKLLENGADKTISAGGHTPLSFATARGHQKIMEMLT